MLRKLKYIILICQVISLSACESGSVGKTLGINKKAPDEFMVVSRPPLTMPPDFNLRAPVAQHEQDRGKVTEEAKNIIFNDSSDSNGSGNVKREAKQLLGIKESNKNQADLTNADKEFLQKSEAVNASEDIRMILHQDIEKQDEVIVEESGFLAGWLPEYFREDEPIVDAAAEQSRIRENMQQNKPATEGETPTKKLKKSVF